MAAFITPDQFLRLYDARSVRENLSDTGTPVLVGDVNTNQNLLDILAMASEMVAAAALVGKRYTEAQLEALAASTTSGFLLRKLVADLAFAMVVGRRGRSTADIDRLCPARALAEQQLEALRTGSHVFPGVNDDNYGDAGLPGSVDMANPNNPNRLITFTARANRLFPFDCRRQNNSNCGC